MVALAVVIVLLVVGSLIFHFASSSLGWYFTPLASNWEHDRLHGRHHVLGLRRRVRRRQPVHRLLRLAVPRPARQQSALRAREHEARDRVDGVHDGRRRGHADARPVRLGGFRPGARRRHDRRSRRQAVALELQAARRRQRAREQRRAAHERRQSARRRPDGSRRPGRHHHREPDPASARSTNRSGRCCARPTCCTTSRFRSSA